MALSFFIIFVFLFLISKYGYAKSFYIYLAYSFFDVGYMFIPPISLKTFLLVPFLLNVLVNRKVLENRKYLFTLSTIMGVFSYICSTALSPTPHYPITLINCFNYFVPSFLLFYYLRKISDVRVLVKYFYWVCMLLLGYGLLEVLMGRSVVIDFINEHNNFGYNLDDVYRYGIKRVQGTFTHATTYGYFAATMLAFYVIFIDEVKEKLNILHNRSIFLYLSLIAMVFLSGTRSAMIPMVLTICYYYREKIRNLSGIGVLLMITGLGYVFAEMFMSDYLNSIINSITNTNDNAVGSSSDMRELQFAIGFEYLMQKPWFGWGTGMTFENVTTSHIDMYGAESIWLPMMIDNGIIGCVAYTLCYIQSYCALRNLCNWKMLFFLFLVLFANTTTSVPGLNVSFILCLVVIIYKLEIFLYEERI